MGKGLFGGLLLVGGVAYFTRNLWGKAQAAKRLDVSLASVSIDHKRTNLSNTVLNVNVSVYNPTDNPLRFEKFTGNVYLDNKRITDIDPKPYEGIRIIKSREETNIPLSIRINNSLLAYDVFKRIVEAIRTKSKVSLTGKVKIIGVVSAEGLSIPFETEQNLSSL